MYKKIEKENINTADTINPPEIKKSFNINALIKNLENHRKGNFFLKMTSELKYTTNLSKLVLQGFSGFAGLAGPGLSLL